MTESFGERAESGVVPADPQAQSAALSPLEKFIRDEVEPQRDELNDWESQRTHAKILLDTAQGQKLHAERIGGKYSQSFTLSRGGILRGGLDGPITTLVSHQALRASASRELTRQYLTASQVPQLPARTFHITQAKSAANYMERLGHPMSISPSSPQVQGGSAANLGTPEQLSHAWAQAEAACAQLPTSQQQIDVEVFLPWILVRTFVVGEEATAAVARVPLYIVGDGEHTALQLAEEELQRRNSCGFLAPVKAVSAADMLTLRPIDPETILSPGDLQVLTHDRSGQTGAGWSVDVTDRISSDVAELAINAMWAFPGLSATAVDILTPALDSAEKALVTHIEPGAGLREFRYPSYGQPRYPNLTMMQSITWAYGR